MSKTHQPYIAECSFCGDGLLRFFRCSECDGFAAVCDECELMWSDIAAVGEDHEIESDSTYPVCPHCEAEKPDWESPDPDAITHAGLDDSIAGTSP